jgi:hypothetical protein
LNNGKKLDEIVESYSNLVQRADDHDRRIEGIENNISRWSGTERRSDAAFSDVQVEKIKALFDERAEVHAGRLAFRTILWALGAAAVGSATTVIALFKK